MSSTTLLSDNGATSGISGYQLTGGDDGTLTIQTTTSGGTPTTAMTIGTDQVVTFAQAPVGAVADGSVTTAKIADANVTSAKIANSGVTAGTYGSASAIPTITVNAKGQVTAVSTNAVSGGVTSVATGNGLSGGPITSTGTLSIAAPAFGSVGSYGVGTKAYTTYTVNSNVASPNYVNVVNNSVGGTYSGTWRVMSGAVAYSSFCCTPYPQYLMVRIA